MGEAVSIDEVENLDGDTVLDGRVDTNPDTEAGAANTEDSLSNRLKDADQHELTKAIIQIEEDLTSLGEKRSAANADVSSVLADCETKGLNRAAVKVGHAYVNWDNKKRDAFMQTLILYLKAHGHHIQMDLFD